MAYIKSDKAEWNLADYGPKVMDFSLLKSPKGTAILAVALAAFALSVAGGVLYSRINASITGKVLMGVGWSVLVGSFVRAYNLENNHKIQERAKEARQKKEINSEHYKIVSWDLSSYRKIPRELATNQTLQAFRQCEDADIICLQRCSPQTKEQIKVNLPPGYASFNYTRKDRGDRVVIWNVETFSLIGHAELDYHHPNTMVLLKDHRRGTTICVDSIRLHGSSSRGKAETKEQRNRLEFGDCQLHYDLSTMMAMQADLYICAGNMNAVRQNDPIRHQLISEEGFSTIDSEEVNTIYAKGHPKRIRSIHPTALGAFQHKGFRYQPIIARVKAPLLVSGILNAPR